jgi:hypothetical protein
MTCQLDMRSGAARLTLVALACVALVSFATAIAVAQEYRAGTLRVLHPWSRPTAPGVSVGAAYFEVRNEGATDDRLVGASTPIAARVEIHETRIVAGVAQMRAQEAVAIVAGRTITAAPGGLHLMLIELRVENRPAPAAAGHDGH